MNIIERNDSKAIADIDLTVKPYIGYVVLALGVVIALAMRVLMSSPDPMMGYGETSLIDVLVEKGLLLTPGLIVMALGGLALWVSRVQRRLSHDDEHVYIPVGMLRTRHVALPLSDLELRLGCGDQGGYAVIITSKSEGRDYRVSVAASRGDEAFAFVTSLTEAIEGGEVTDGEIAEGNVGDDEEQARRLRKAVVTMGSGAAWFFGGSLITGLSYVMAGPGDYYVLAWGAVGIGFFEMLYGFGRWLTLRSPSGLRVSQGG